MLLGSELVSLETAATTLVLKRSSGTIPVSSFEASGFDSQFAFIAYRTINSIVRGWYCGPARMSLQFPSMTEPATDLRHDAHLSASDTKAPECMLQ